MSELMATPTPRGAALLDSEMLQERNKGMKSKRATERAVRRLGDQMRHLGNVHRYRPNQSPTLKTTK